jgi:hypothetical protein
MNHERTEVLIPLMEGEPRKPPPPKFAYRLRLHRAGSAASLPGCVLLAHEQDGQAVLSTLLTREKALWLADELRRLARML